jgi:hypothetical protein
MRNALALLVLAMLGGCAGVWSDRYNAADVSHRMTAELCREGSPSEQEFARCMEELLPPVFY